MITDDNAGTTLIEAAKIAVVGLDDHGHGHAAGDNRALFDRRNPLTRAQFVAGWRAGAVPLEIYRLGYDRYIAAYEMRQYRHGSQARKLLPKGGTGQCQSSRPKQASGIALVDTLAVAIAALKRGFMLAGLRHRDFATTPRK